MLFLRYPGTVDGEGEIDSVLFQEAKHVIGQKDPVRAHSEMDIFAGCIRFLDPIGHDSLDEAIFQ